ncbi:2-dehydropantoate 2-reductase [Paenibacillus athensensis]|uniref:2-dehydropantoate 2-reductase n=1 Tax=Paenibacillus athensensis TaxID=1967502 RepID=A0A4Y8PSB4_9BACL|nr:2-dehydropantoate 2-reductase [Paenibacillus athensensis]MCD1261521.1 2-dehydropantoate 2-reductase [Paenibacillus athensensis]
MRIAVMGAGSLGLLFAARLAASGAAVELVTRTVNQAELLQFQGIRLMEPDGSRQIVRPAVISAWPQRPLAQAPDVLLLTLKQPALTEELLVELALRLAANTLVVGLQNGIGHEDKLRSALGADRVTLAVTTEAARRESATGVTHTGRGMTYIESALHDGSEAEQGNGRIERQKLLLGMLRQAGFSANLSNDMDIRIWTKLLINAVINPLTAMLQVNNGGLLHSRWALGMMEALLEEGKRVAALQGVRLPDDLWQTVLDVCTATADNHSSMLRDVQMGRPTEIDTMNGSLLRIAEKHGLTLPEHQTVYRFVKALEPKR